MFYADPRPRAEDLAVHLTEAVRPALGTLAGLLRDAAWTREALQAALKQALAEHSLKMPQLAIPVRLLVFGLSQTPSVDACLALLSRERVIERLLALPNPQA
jgi:glutamyl-tRNA synthetase